MDIRTICPLCGAEIHGPRLDFCPDCGIAITEARIRREAIERRKALKEQPQIEVNWLDKLPEKWKLKYIRNIIINFVIFSVVATLVVFFWKAEEEEFSLKLLVVAIVVILGTVVYAVGTLDKTPLVKYRLIRRMCGLLRSIRDKGPPPG